MNKQTRNDSQRGAVSLFIVIFCALLITIVTISFVQIMLRNQQEATTADISQSAYDSALAGVEDAKRALVTGANFDPNDCSSIKAALGYPVTSGETKIQQDEQDQRLDQAYTCVKIDTEPEDLGASLLYEDSLKSSAILPLRIVGGTPFDTIEISWKSRSNLVPTSSPGATSLSLPRTGEWGEATPSLLRAQLIQYDGTFDLSSFDSSSDGSPSSGARTKFLYPFVYSSNPVNDISFGNDSSPQPVACSKTDTYTCSVKLKLEGSQNYKSNVFLRLTALYNNADVRVKVYSGGTALAFSDVQAKVDSTGRAGDAFRRVNAIVNLSLNDNFPYPQAALDLDGNLCKTFKITNDPNQYDPGLCDPDNS